MKSLTQETLDWANEQREANDFPRLAEMPQGRNASTTQSSLANALPGRWNCVTRTHWIGGYSTFTELPPRVQRFQERAAQGRYPDLDERE